MKMHLILPDYDTCGFLVCFGGERLAVQSQVDALVEEQEGKPIEDVILQATRNGGLSGGSDPDHPKPPHPKPPMKVTRTISKAVLNEKDPSSKGS
jgi:hypothetical protein